VESVSLGLYFRTGSRHETPANNGISHLIEHLVFKGTRRRSAEQINREVDLLGGASNAYTGKETLCFHARVLAEHLPRLVDLFGDMAANALPPGLDSEVEREREVVLSEIAAVDDSPEDLVGDLCDVAYFGAHPLGLPVVGSIPSVSNLDLDQIRRHFRERIVARDMVVAAAGKVDHDALVDLADEKLGAIPRGAPQAAEAPPTPEAGSRLIERELEQVQVCLSARGVRRSDPARHAAEILSAVVGDGVSSRLFREVRDRRGLAYSIYSSLASYLDAGSFNIYFGVSPDKLDRTFEVVGQVLAGIRGGEIFDDELEAAKLHVRAGTILTYEAPTARMGHLAETVLVGEDRLEVEHELAGIEAVQLSAVRELAAKLLEGPMALAAVGPVRADRLPRDGWEIPS
jgi:predicted Zn-dependent peptidase